MFNSDSRFEAGRTWRACRFVHALFWILCITGVCFAQPEPIPLPEVRVDGHLSVVHSQGLYVTKSHYLVTGRLETKPKRALLFRFSREDPAKYETMELTPPSQDGAVLDHPGGFDRDKNGVYWIPVSTSNRRGPTIIYGITITDTEPLAEATIHCSLRFDDHLGALCCFEKQLLVANWDTKTVYWLNTNGDVKKKLERDQLIGGDPEWFLAVQDWKYDRQRQLVVAGGIDKSPNPNAKQTVATLAWIDFKSKSVRSSRRFPPLQDTAKPLTNEGMAWFDGDLFLLPGDLGHDAKIFRFRDFGNGDH